MLCDTAIAVDERHALANGDRHRRRCDAPAGDRDGRAARAGFPVPVPAPPADGRVGELPPPHAASATSAVAAIAFPMKSLLTPITKTSCECRVRKTSATG